MAKYQNFDTAKPTKPGWYWMQNITTTDEPEIVYVRPVDLHVESSELGFQRHASGKITSFNNTIADLMQWQVTTWD